MRRCGVLGSVVCLFLTISWIVGVAPVAAGDPEDEETPRGTTTFGIPCPGFADSLWKCVDVSPLYESFKASIGHSVSGRMVSLAVAGDGKRLYAAAFSGVWRSDDGGGTWRQMTQPQASEFSYSFDGTMPPNVYSLAVSRKFSDIVLAATTDDHRQEESLNGIYRSTNGGETWTRVHRFDCDGKGTNAGQIVYAPDEPGLVFAAGGCTLAWSPDSGATWYDLPLPNGAEAWHVAVGPHQGPTSPPPGTHFIRRVYAAGPREQLWYSEDGGVSWDRDSGVISISEPKGYGGNQAPFGEFSIYGGGDGSAMIAVEPGHPERLYLAAYGMTANGPSFFHPRQLGDDGIIQCTGRNVSPLDRPCGGASLWIGDYSKFDPGRGAQWTQVHGPPGYYWGGTGSGATYIATKDTADGYLLFLSDRDDVHVSNGYPLSAASWHRLGGRDISQSWCAGCAGNDDTGGNNCNQFQIHRDPHVVAVSPDFAIALAPPGACKFPFLTVRIPYPYDQNSVLDSYKGGTIWIANDGGIYRSRDGGTSWELGKNLSTLQPQGPFAALFLHNKAPALYFGVPDDDDFFSRDGGITWKDSYHYCGDCGAWFSDPHDPTRVLESNRISIDSNNKSSQRWSMYVCSSKGQYPDTGSKKHAYLDIPLPSGTILTDDAARRGYKPVVVGIADERTPSGGDYIFLRDTPSGLRVVLRTQSLAKVKKIADWDWAASQQGSRLPPEVAGATVVQASGGHQHTVFYVGDPDFNKTLWRSTKSGWERIVPSADGSATMARRFFVSPYDPSLIYIVDESAVKYSTDGGSTWNIDFALDQLVTDNHTLTYDYGDDDIGYGVIRDMVFDRDYSPARAAVGDAGVFVTLGPTGWYRVLSTRQMPGHPVAVSFNPFLKGREMYVAVNGHGILHLTRVPE
jgi:photosystem II stability/assembly factor-like uncharacterized protein